MDSSWLWSLSVSIVDVSRQDINPFSRTWQEAVLQGSSKTARPLRYTSMRIFWLRFWILYFFMHNYNFQKQFFHWAAILRNLRSPSIRIILRKRFFLQVRFFMHFRAKMLKWILLILSISGMSFSLYWEYTEWGLAHTEYKRNKLNLIPIILGIRRNFGHFWNLLLIISVS
jgi:hypothetical protein